MSKKVLKYSIKLNVNDIWLFSFYTANKGFLGIFNLIFTLASIYILISTWNTSDITRKIVFLISALLFSIIQPVILYIKALKQSKTIGIKKGFALDISNDGLRVSQDDDIIELDWNHIYKTKLMKSMIIIYLSPLRAYLIPKRYIVDDKEDLFTLLKNNTKITRF